jgi:hypothetical protein
MFIVARGKAERIHEGQAYLYGGQSIVSEPVLNGFGSAMVIVESVHGMAGKMLADRLSSGLFGAWQCETLEQANAYIQSEMM